MIVVAPPRMAAHTPYFCSTSARAAAREAPVPRRPAL